MPAEPHEHHACAVSASQIDQRETLANAGVQAGQPSSVPAWID